MTCDWCKRAPAAKGATTCFHCTAVGRRGYLAPRCYECIDVASHEDPAPWCDCRPDESCFTGPCRRRAHDPVHCPIPGVWPAVKP